jgi:hypothetical protein
MTGQKIIDSGDLLKSHGLRVTSLGRAVVECLDAAYVIGMFLGFSFRKSDPQTEWRR